MTLCRKGKFWFLAQRHPTADNPDRLRLVSGLQMPCPADFHANSVNRWKRVDNEAGLSFFPVLRFRQVIIQPMRWHNDSSSPLLFGSTHRTAVETVMEPAAASSFIRELADEGTWSDRELRGGRYFRLDELLLEPGRMPPFVGRQVSFSALVEAVRENRTDATIAALADAVVRLSKWHFVARGQFPNVLPFIGVVDGQPLVVAFSQPALAYAYAVNQQLAMPDGAFPVLSLPVSQAYDLVRQLGQQGVTGILFDERPNGVGAVLPLASLPPLRR